MGKEKESFENYLILFNAIQYGNVNKLEEQIFGTNKGEFKNKIAHRGNFVKMILKLENENLPKLNLPKNLEALVEEERNKRLLQTTWGQVIYYTKHILGALIGWPMLWGYRGSFNSSDSESTYPIPAVDIMPDITVRILPPVPIESRLNIQPQVEYKQFQEFLMQCQYRQKDLILQYLQGPFYQPPQRVLCLQCAGGRSKNGWGQVLCSTFQLTLIKAWWGQVQAFLKKPAKSYIHLL